MGNSDGRSPDLELDDSPDVDFLADKVIGMQLDGLPAHSSGHPCTSEADQEYWQAVEDLAYHPNFYDVLEELPLGVRAHCEEVLL